MRIGKLARPPYGYNSNGIATDLAERMENRTPSLYLRQRFTVSAENAALEEAFKLRALADSGFVAYINGHEIARGNLGQRHGFIYHDQSAFSSADDDKTNTYESVVLASNVLREGENVFAVQVQNTVPSQINERDKGVDNSLKFEADLTLGLGIFRGGSNIAIPLPDEGWKYRIGFAEPSGGMVDWAQAEHPDVEASFSDWIELHNNGAEEVDLTGWHLTDDKDQPMLWRFPDGTKIAADGYLVVLADSNTEVPGDYLHASFNLSAGGEFLALVNASNELVSQFEDGFPNQRPFQSYGIGSSGDGSYAYLSEPSPGKANSGPELEGFVKKPKFSPEGGVYDSTTEVTLTSSTEGAVIRYTIDGSEPSETNGLVYEGPLSIEPIDERTGTAIRAIAFQDGMGASKESTQTYLVGVDEVFKTIPSVSVVADPGYAFYKPHGIMSVVGGSGVGNDWRSTGVEDYYMPDMHGRAFEKKMSMEIIYPEEGTNVQIDGGIRLAASAWSRGRFSLTQVDRSPWPSNASQKPSFNVFFRGDYGDDTLNFPLIENYPVRTFRQLRMRAGKNDINNPWITDELSRRLVIDTGQLGSIGINNALFVNGVYKGYYNSVARLREELFQDLYGSNEPWQVKHIDVWADGSPHEDALLDTPEWDHLEELLAADLDVAENYEAVLQELDPVNFADYFIVNIYGATWDWPHNNLVIARELTENGRWRGYMWDAEGMFGVAGGHGVNYNTMTSDLNNKRGTTPSDDLATIWNGLRKSTEWRVLFADRLHKHFFTPGGALTEENIERRLQELVDTVGPLMRFGGGGAIRTNSITNWINGRERVLFDSGKQFEKEDLWSGVQAANFSPNGGAVDAGTAVKITTGTLFNVQKGDIYYTTDGSDPRLPGGAANPNATIYDREANTGVIINSTMPLKARVFATSLFEPPGHWSPLQETTFRVGLEPATGQNLILSELMVAPQRPTEAEAAADYSTSDFEYLEFYNPTDVTVDLAGIRFTAGINYIFSEGDVTTLGPKAYGVLVNDREAFASRYGEGLPILGQFNKKLSNGGEHLEISNANFEPIVSITYSDSAPWPDNAEPTGNSLVRSDLSPEIDGNDAANWAMSSSVGGSPGRAEGAGPPDPNPTGGYDTWKTAQFTAAEATDAAISGLTADPDGDGSSNLTEFAFGTLPKEHNSNAGPLITVDGDTVSLTYTRRTDTDTLTYTIEQSSDLVTWADADAAAFPETATAPAGDDLETVTVQASDSASANYIRWRIELQE